MSAKIRIFQDVKRYLSGSYVSQALDMITAILVRRFLGPTLMGVWSFCNVLLSYAKYVSLGTTDAAIKEIPYCLARGEGRKVEDVQNIVFTFTTLTAILFGLGVLGYAWFSRSKFSSELFWGLVVVSLVIVLQRIHNLLISYLRAHKDFTLISKQVIFSSVVQLISVVLLAWKFGSYGYFGAVTGTYVANIAYVQIKHPFWIRFDLNLKKIKPILALGIPLLLSGIFLVIFMSVDKLMISWKLGFKDLGYYSLALMAHNYISNMPNLIGIVLFPYFQERFGPQESEEGLTEYVLKPMLLLGGFLPLPIGLAWILSPILTSWLLPDFVPGIPALQILILGTFFLSLCHQTTHSLITTNKLNQLLKIRIAMVGFAFGVTWLLLQWGWGLNGVAAATSVSFFMNFVLLYFVGERSLEREMAKEAFRYLAAVFLYFSSLLFLIQHWIRIPGSLALETACHLLVYAVGILPLLFIKIQNTGLLQEMFSLLRHGKSAGALPTEEVAEA